MWQTYQALYARDEVANTFVNQDKIIAALPNLSVNSVPTLDAAASDAVNALALPVGMMLHELRSVLRAVRTRFEA